MASTWLSGLVSPSPDTDLTDSSRIHLQSSMTMWWVRQVGRLLGVVGKWCGRLRYVHHCAFAPVMLTSFVPCTAH